MLYLLLCSFRHNRIFPVFSLIHKLIGTDRSILHRFGPITQYSANAHRKAQVRIAWHIGIADLFLDPAQAFLKLCLADIRHQKKEFIASVTDDGIFIPHTVPKHLDQGSQHGIACVMSPGIVVELKVIQVDHGYAALLG